jgi:bacillithiol biosynthesis deacetylase BshB1
MSRNIYHDPTQLISLDEDLELDMLVFAPHPDDAELSCGGLIAKSVTQGHRVGIVDFTLGELSSQGEVEERVVEARNAAEVLGVAIRCNLEIPDGFSVASSSYPNPDSNKSDAPHEPIAKIVQCIRKWRPRVVVLPFDQARHPDHSACGHLATQAVFFAGVKKYQPNMGLAHSVGQTILYQMRFSFTPSFVCDISEVHALKRKSIDAHESQVRRQGGSNTLISSPLALAAVDARDRFYGAMIGVEYAEPFLIRNALSVPDPIAHFTANPGKQALIYPEVS